MTFSATDFTHPMDYDEFRKQGHALVDLIADYHQRIPEPVAPVSRRPGDLLRLLPDHPPQDGEPFELILSDLRSQIMPALTHWLSPSFFGYFPANSSFPAILGDLVSSGLNQQGMLWLTSPASAELETRTLDWLAHMLDLPHEFQHASGKGGGVIHGTASEAILVALVAARHRMLGRLGDPNDPELRTRLVAYGSDQTHSSLQKACRVLGLCDHQLRLIPSRAGSMQPEALTSALEEDLAAKRIPFFVCGTVGTTSSASIDPIQELGEISQRYQIWFHIDAAFAGSACICPEFRPLINGVELADSFNFNPHKWMLVTFDCSAFFVRDKKTLTDSLSVTPEYLRNVATESGEATDFRDWQIPLGRRFRSLKLWFVLRSYGVSGLQSFIRHSVAMAQHFEAWIAKESRLEMLLPRSLSLVCFRVAHPESDAKKADAQTKKLLAVVNGTGQAFLTHTILSGHYVIRASFAGQYTMTEHVDELQQLLSSGLDNIE